MGLAAAIPATSKKSSEEIEVRPIDLVHLAKQTLGDRSLEQEVLKLFLTQADVYMEKVETAGDAKSLFSAAHTIKGSARNIGAWVVADVAAHLESAAEDEIMTDLMALKQALDETRAFIHAILDDA